MPQRLTSPMPEVAAPCVGHARLQQSFMELEKRQLAAVEGIKDGLNGKVSVQMNSMTGGKF